MIKGLEVIEIDLIWKFYFLGLVFMYLEDVNLNFQMMEINNYDVYVL